MYVTICSDYSHYPAINYSDKNTKFMNSNNENGLFYSFSSIKESIGCRRQLAKRTKITQMVCKTNLKVSITTNGPFDSGDCFVDFEEDVDE